MQACSANARAILRGSVLVAAALAASACRTVPATQVLVFFHADDETRASAVALRVRVIAEDGSVLVDREDPIAPGTVGHLARVPLIPASGDASRRFAIEGALLDAAGAARAELGASAGYVASERRELHLWFDPECVGHDACGVGRTCERGVCVGDCFAPDEGTTNELRSSARCTECEICSSGACAPRPAGSSCGCEGDRCESGACVPGVTVRAVFAGRRQTCVIGGGNGVYCWGSDATGQTAVGIDTDVPTRVAEGIWQMGACQHESTCALGVFGERVCWGWNTAGALGDGTDVGTPAPPTTIEEPLLDVIDGGWFHGSGVGEDGRLYAWGMNSRGEVGEGVGVPVLSPRVIAPGDRFVEVASGGFHNCALRDDRRIVCWGLNDSGELGTGDFVDRTAPTESGCIEGACRDDWQTLGAGDFHTCGIRTGGELWCWGGGLYGQLGAGPMLLDDIALPTGPLAGGPYAIVAGGGSHTCAITLAGELSCWGRNHFGQIGVGSTEQIDRPTRVSAPGNVEFAELGLGTEHTCAIRTDGTLWCWGSNADGQLGLGLSGGAGERVTAPRRVCFPVE